MNIEVVRTFGFAELAEKIRSVPLMQKDAGGEEIFPYRDAHIRLRSFHSEDVNPPTFYLLQKNVQLQKSLHQALLVRGYDFLHLTDEIAGLEIHNKDSGELWTLIPPIIESTSREVRFVQQPGEIDYGHLPTRITVQLICDGAHRVALSRELRGIFSGIHISGVDLCYPYYAHPNGWDMVKIVDEVPATMEEKKLYRLQDCYALYRNFDRIGCGKPRGFGTTQSE